MKLGFMAMISKQKPSLRNGCQQCHPHPKKNRKFSPMWKWCCVFVLSGSNLSWISTSWPGGEQGILSEGSEEKKAWFVEGGKKMVAPTWRALAHFSLLICDFLTKHEVTLVSQPPYLPRFAPSRNPYWKDDLSLLRRLKKIHWLIYAVFQKRHSRNTSKTGRNTGSNV